MLNSAFLYSFQSNKETENQMFKIGLGRIGCLQVVVDDVDEHEAAFVQAEVVALADGRPLGLEEEAATGFALVHLVEVVAGCAVSGLLGGCRAGGGGNGMDRFHPLRVSRFLRRRIITY